MKSTPIEFKTSDIITICGQRGKGKTVWAKQYLKTFKGSFIIYDLNGEYENDFPNNTYVPKGSSQEEFEILARKVWEKGNITIVVDEAESIFPVHKPLPLHTGNIIRRGRHKGIGFIALTRRIADFNKTIVSLSAHIIMYSLFLPNDLKYLGEFIHPNNAEKLPTLEKYHWLYYGNGKCTLFKPVKI